MQYSEEEQQQHKREVTSLPLVQLQCNASTSLIAAWAKN
jgi:hypothetical protein